MQTGRSRGQETDLLAIVRVSEHSGHQTLMSLQPPEQLRIVSLVYPYFLASRQEN